MKTLNQLLFIAYFLQIDSSEDIFIDIFFALMKYIKSKFPDGFVDDILEQILVKSIMYSKNAANGINSHHSGEWFQIYKWLKKVLSSQSNCPNPYLRLELFRLMRIAIIPFEIHLRECVCETFICTICEIHPFHFYFSGDVGNRLFGVQDFEYFITQLKTEREYMIYQDMPLRKVCFYNHTEKFICHLLQLVELYVRISTTMDEFNLCFNIFLAFCPIYDFPEFYSDAVDTYCELTAASLSICGSGLENTILLLEKRAANRFYPAIKDNKTSDIPRLLLSRQIHGSKALRQHALVLSDLEIYYTDRTFSIGSAANYSDDDIGDDSSEYSNSSNNNVSID